MLQAIRIFWHTRLVPTLDRLVDSLIPGESHTFGEPEKREFRWLGITWKRWTVSSDKAKKTRQDDIEIMRAIANRGRR